jgi:hypothetical protein
MTFINYARIPIVAGVLHVVVVRLQECEACQWTALHAKAIYAKVIVNADGTHNSHANAANVHLEPPR